MDYGFVRGASVSPLLSVCDCEANTNAIIDTAKQACEKGAGIIVFPELSITGYTCGDLFLQTALRSSAEKCLEKIIAQTANLPSLIFVGLPLSRGEGIYNCAAAIYKGRLLALFAKSYLPNYGEFYERRQFTPFAFGKETEFISFAGFDQVPFGVNILLSHKNNPELCIACEICEDLWVPLPPSTYHSLAGATVIVNPSAGNEVIGKASYRTSLVKATSARNVCAYIYAAAGNGESTQDMVFAGHNLICENGTLLSQSELFSGSAIYADIDFERLCQERRRTTSFSDSVKNADLPSYHILSEDFSDILCNFNSYSSQPEKSEQGKIGFQTSESNSSSSKQKLLRFVDAHPFVPSERNARALRCKEVITLQAQGLAKRIRHIHCQSAVIGLSGGLDSTLALLVTAYAFDLCNISRSKITAITMPCFGTTDRTYNNACTLAKECGATLKEVKIAASVRQHFADIGQDESVHDVTYENCQARERTQVLMDYANKTNGMVIGTGDLSELALGWCTYNGDHMSMYGVNSSVPKTLVRYLVEWFCDDEMAKGHKKYAAVLHDILETPVSPELLPPQDGKISQVTEDLVGPYELHDFYLYYLLRFGFSPKKILFLAEQSELPYSKIVKLKWLKTFYKRFFTQQFKRSCLPDGVKVGTVSLSPRGDWRMPSDAVASVWLKEVDEITIEEENEEVSNKSKGEFTHPVAKQKAEGVSSYGTFAEHQENK